MNRPIVYLAGPITGQTLGGANDWRTSAIEYLSGQHCINAISPLRGKEYLNAQVESDGVYRKLYDVHPMSTAHGINQRDHWDVMRCDLLFAYLGDVETVSIGTVMEIAWAKAYNKYSIAVITENSAHDHGMIRDSVSLIMTDLQEAIDLIPVILATI